MTAVILGSTFGGMTGFAADGPRTVPTSFHTSYLPEGFDSNDHVQIVGEGNFTSTCYRPATAEYSIDHKNHLIEVLPKSYEYDGLCIQMMVPWHQVLDLGLLQAGKYKIIERGSQDSQLGSLNVRVATNSDPDDFLYAPVDQAWFERVDGMYYVKISGVFSSNCVELVDVMHEVQKNVIIVQPVTEMKDSEDCATGWYPYEKTIALGDVPAGRFLLHVRSLNGTSVNNLVDAE